MSTFQPKQSELGIVNGVPLPEMPEDLFIPPQALEICLETFTGPMDLLLHTDLHHTAAWHTLPPQYGSQGSMEIFPKFEARQFVSSRSEAS